MNWNQFKANWTTTVAGLVASAAGFVAMFPEHFSGHPLISHIAQYVSIGGLAAIGILAKSADVTGTGDSAKKGS